MPLNRNKKIIIYIFLFLFVGTLNNKNFSNTGFIQLKKIHISGLDKENQLDLRNKLNPIKLDNLLFIEKSTIHKIINSNKLVESYSVIKKYPSSIDIIINQTEFLAQFKKNGKDYFLGSNWKIIEIANFKIDIPFLYGEFKVKDFIKLKKAIDETNFNYNEVKNLYFFKSGRWDVETSSGLIVKLPNKNIKKSLQLVTEILKNNNQNNILKIDLRRKNQIIING